MNILTLLSTTVAQHVTVTGVPSRPRTRGIKHDVRPRAGVN